MSDSSDECTEQSTNVLQIYNDSSDDQSTQDKVLQIYNDVMLVAAELGDVELLELAINRGATGYSGAAIAAMQNNIPRAFIDRLIERCDLNRMYPMFAEQTPALLLELLKEGRVTKPMPEVYAKVCSKSREMIPAANKNAERIPLVEWIIARLKAEGAADDVYIVGLNEAIYSQNVHIVKLAWEACAGITSRTQSLVSPLYNKYREGKPMIHRCMPESDCMQYLVSVGMYFPPRGWRIAKAGLMALGGTDLPSSWMLEYEKEHLELAFC